MDRGALAPLNAMPPDLVGNITNQFLADGLSALNSVGPALVGLAMGMLLFLRVLQLLSRRFAGKDFRIVPVQRRGKSSFDFVVGKWEKLDSSTVPIPTVRDEHKPESGSEFWNNPRVGIWGEIGLALRGDI